MSPTEAAAVLADRWDNHHGHALRLVLSGVNPETADNDCGHCMGCERRNHRGIYADLRFRR